MPMIPKGQTRSISIRRLRGTLLCASQYHATQRQRTATGPRCILINPHERLLGLKIIARGIDLLILFYQGPVFLEIISLVAVLLCTLLDERSGTIKFAVDGLNGDLCPVVLN